MRAMVTGGAGFIGRHLIPVLRQTGYACSVVDPVCTESFEHWLNSVFSCLADRFDVVIHLGANIAPIDERSKGGIQHYQDLALDLAVAQWVAKYPPKKCFIYPSSCAVNAPDDPYGWVKATGEKLCYALAADGVPVVILRLFSGYGHDQAETYPFPAILKRVLRGDDPVMVWGSGQQVRDWIHVDDLARVFVWAIEKAPRNVPVEIGTGRGINFILLAQLMLDAVGRNVGIVADRGKPESGVYRVADTRCAVENGFEARINICDGILNSVATLQPKLNKVGVAGVSLDR